MAAITGLIIASIIASLAGAAASAGVAVNAQQKQNEAIDSTNQTNLQINNSNNAFNAEQAQIQRDWEERMANTAIQRKVADLKAAGFNPALAVTSGASFTPGASGATSAGNVTMRAHDYSPMAQLSQNLSHLVNSASNLVLLNRLSKSNPQVIGQLDKMARGVTSHITSAQKFDDASDIANSEFVRSVNLWK